MPLMKCKKCGTRPEYFVKGKTSPKLTESQNWNHALNANLKNKVSIKCPNCENESDKCGNVYVAMRIWAAKNRIVREDPYCEKLYQLVETATNQCHLCTFTNSSHCLLCPMHDAWSLIYGWEPEEEGDKSESKSK